MLPRKNRLTIKADFQRVIRRGASFSFGDVSVRVIKNNTKSSRFGILVGKKSGKSAVKRNRIKRLLRGWLRTNLKEFCPGYDVVIISKFCEKEGAQFKLNGQQFEKKFTQNQLLLKKQT
jgi:ribonuclease P protein component